MHSITGFWLTFTPSAWRNEICLMRSFLLPLLRSERLQPRPALLTHYSHPYSWSRRCQPPVRHWSVFIVERLTDALGPGAGAGEATSTCSCLWRWHSRSGESFPLLFSPKLVTFYPLHNLHHTQKRSSEPVTVTLMVALQGAGVAVEWKLIHL